MDEAKEMHCLAAEIQIQSEKGMFIKKARNHSKVYKEEEMMQAEKDIIVYVQRKSFQEEISSLKKANPELKTKKKGQKKKPLKKSSSICRQNAPVSQSMKHPVILPNKHHVSDLLVRHYHQVTSHSGVEYVLAKLRENFWIVNGRCTVRKLLYKCFDCSRQQASFGNQKMSDLPEDRVTPSQAPFTHTGVDCFGPMYVKRGRSIVKRYGVLFPCLAIRAVHIEVAYSLDTDYFIDALRRFISRRGQPKEMRSDNGTNFVSGEKELCEAIKGWNMEKIGDFLLQQNIKEECGSDASARSRKSSLHW